MPTNRSWVTNLTLYQGADLRISLQQVANTVFPYLGLMALMFFLLYRGFPYWIVLLLVPITSLFLVRVFIILHDCSHKSFFRSPRTCFALGHVLGIFTFWPFFDFRQTHIIHHSTVANLDKRGIGDVWTMTIDEYRAAKPWVRFWYRLYRNPFFLFLIAPTVLFVVVNRFPHSKSRLKDVLSIVFTDIALVLVILAAHFTIGVKTYVAVQLPVLFLAANMGVWIFYINHQFEGVYWARNKDWNWFDASFKGSSCYEMPAFFRWFFGNIGYHHIHHLNFTIPNYRLERCLHDIPELQSKPLPFLKGFNRDMFLALWDEKAGKLVRFSALKSTAA